VEYRFATRRGETLRRERLVHQTHAQARQARQELASRPRRIASENRLRRRSRKGTARTGRVIIGTDS
jgi:hypothetical protein